ncbi:uncharacterized protein LOC144010691 [Festucalex cinctus]
MNQKLNLLSKMNTQELILIFLLHFEVMSGQAAEVFARAGDVAVLPCKQPSCSGIDWLYSWDESLPEHEVRKGQVVTSSPRRQRLSLQHDCSLRIDHVMAEDVGYYGCKKDGHLQLNIFLTVMTLTPQDSDSMTDVLLKCSLTCYLGPRCRCGPRDLRWMDEDDEELSSDHIEQDYCVSFLKVPPVSRKRNYKCQYVEVGKVKVQAEYTANSTEESTRGPEGPVGLDGPGAPQPDRTRLINIIRLAVAILILVGVVMSAVVVEIKLRQKRQARVQRVDDHIYNLPD